jgi:TonB-linked SusC/RagA family outer membrane protein
MAYRKFTRWVGALLCLCFATSASFAQNLSLTGRVSNSKGDGIAGATVILINEGNRKPAASAVTNDRGIYLLNNLLPTVSYELQISAVGYAPITQKAIALNSSGDNSRNITLQESNSAMDSVIVTALGIKREQKALGYAAQSIGDKDVNDARSNNWVSALSGKVAGLQLLSAGSGPLNSTRVILRGDASMDLDNNNALVVVDGVPLVGSGTSSGVNNAYGAGSGNDVPVDFGNGISNINPDDIESISVLKGPGATALYGSRAANGALLITTKSGGRNKKGIGISVNSNISTQTVLRWPDYQYEYGQGTGRALNAAGEKYYSYGASADGPSTSGTSSAFGPRFNGQRYFQYDPVRQGAGLERTLWRPYEDNIKGFWRTGSTITNNIALEGGSEQGSVRASFTHSKNEWIMPNTGFERITGQLSVNYKLSDRLKLNAKAIYTNKNSDNLPATGYNNQSIAYFMIFQNPNVDLNWYRDVWKQGQEGIDQIHPFSSFIDNPFLIAYEMTNSMRGNDLVGSLSASYQFSKKFDLMLRSNINTTSEDRQMRRPFSTANYLRGYYKEQSIRFSESNSDFLFSYHDRFGKNFRVNASVGANHMRQNYDRLDASVEGLVIPQLFNLANGQSAPFTVAVDRDKVINSVYGLASFSYQDKYFIDFTGRNDWSSALPPQFNSYFYSSANLSLVLSQIFKLPTAVSFAKLRFSAAKVGADTDPYRTDKYYGASPFPGSASVPTTLHNTRLKPQTPVSYEAGLDLRFFKSRLRADISVYQNTTGNQILAVPLDPTTGYTTAFLNSGEVRNRGMEVILSADPVKNKNFQWTITANWAKNVNRVLSLAEGLTDKQDIGYGGNATIQARVGGSVGDIYGFGFVRSPDGQIVYNSNGLPERPADIQYIGNAFADWRGGIQNEFRYKNFRFSFLFDGQYGGLIYSQTHHKMTEQGKLKHTLRGREENFIIGEGVVRDAGGRFVPNTTKVLPVDYYAEYYRRANVEANSFDASFIKLREARIEYNLPAKLMGRVVRGATFAVYGRDLLLFTDFPIFDPETAALNGSSLLPGVEMGQLPSTRTMGVNLTFKF